MRKGAREGGEGASPSRELEKNERITEGRKVKEEEEEVVAAEEKEEGGRMGDVGGRSGRSSDIYPINRSESSNRGSGDRSDTYTCIHTYAPFRVPPRGRPCGYQKAPLRIYLMPNVDLLCLITGVDIDGSVCASKRRAAGGREGLVPVACSQSHPFLRAGSGGGEATEALGHCRTKWLAILSSWSGGFEWGGSEGVGRGRPSDTGN